ncbi:PilN domain-containing protein [Lacimicrobium alkaliphilum]|uniref:Fimbrial protein n=1 Tax=Lacimicrobium alkaliphilum TaxID=1526571 RepID=A0ABQ1RMZ5_9ALTE|nr:PilN domain-containing protein [Lacimicrobium alkaliphilum]GGD73635.1 fimbrial protein [Lacimicrobium alkaliphilum]
MAHINLLPWREAHRQKKKKEYITLLALLAVFVLALFWLIGTMVDTMISNQQQRNNFLQQRIDVLDSQIAKIRDIKDKKKDLERRMALIEQLQTNRNVAPQVLDELARILPPGVSFRSLVRRGNQLEVLGVSESNNRLSEFMRQLELSRVFNRGELSSIVADTSSSDAVSEFKLTFNISAVVAPQMVTEGAEK